MRAAVVVIILSLICLSGGERIENPGSPRLVAIQQLNDFGEMCTWESMTAAGPQESNLFGAFEETAVHASSQNGGDTGDVTRPPVRTLRDTYPVYSSVAVNPEFGEVILQDNNLWSTAIFKRTDNTPPDAPFTEPQRLIKGPSTDIQFNNGLYVDPKIGEIYSVESDTGDKIVVFGHDSLGNVAPIRILKTPHRGFGIAVDEDRQEMYVTVEYPPQIAVYRKQASGNEKPLRVIAGDHTGLESTHGITLDMKNRVMFVNNWGNFSNFRVQGSGKFNPPSITVYPLDASGDTLPVRVIQGNKTQLNWPGAMALNSENGDLYVANDVGNSLLIFRASDKGDVAPSRVVKGSKTGLKNPTGVALDLKNKEVWVSNLSNSSATCYSLTANGDVAPIRTIRSAPLNRVGLNLGKTEAVAYDSKRDELLVPN